MLQCLKHPFYALIMLIHTYYAQDYAGIIGWSPVTLSDLTNEIYKN